jgi:hypothetical protein
MVGTNEARISVPDVSALRDFGHKGAACRPTVWAPLLRHHLPPAFR